MDIGWASGSECLLLKPSTEEGGRPAFDPQLLISLWINAYSQRIGSAREVARRCEYDPAFPVAHGMGGSELPHACGLPAKNDYWSGGTNALFAVDVQRPAIGTDRDGHSGLLPEPVECPAIPLAMAERSEVIIDFSKCAVGTHVILRNLNGEGLLGGIKSPMGGSVCSLHRRLAVFFWPTQ